MDVHVVHAWLVPEEMIVESGHLESVLEQRGHHGIDLLLQQHEVAHHDVHSCAFGHPNPSSESKWRGRRNVRNCDLEVVPRDVDLQYLVLEIALFPEGR